MKRLYASIILAALLTLAVAPAPPAGARPGASQPDAMRMGIISYWKPDSPDWHRVPPDSVLVINPDSGILAPNSDQPVGNWSEWVGLVNRLKKDPLLGGKRLRVLGYVPTGYFDHTCVKEPKPDCQAEARIRLQVKTYYERMPALDGIFYDETSPKSEMTKGKSEEEVLRLYDAEYKLLRSINSAPRVTVFNVGWASGPAVAVTNRGEHLVLYESAPYGYTRYEADITRLTKEARAKGVVVWHLMHSVCREDLYKYMGRMAERCADYVYITNIGGDWRSGENTWGELPSYWEQELDAFAMLGNLCPARRPPN